MAVIGERGWYAMENGELKRVEAASEVIGHWPVDEIPLILEKAAAIDEATAPTVEDPDFQEKSLQKIVNNPDDLEKLVDLRLWPLFGEK